MGISHQECGAIRVAAKMPAQPFPPRLALSEWRVIRPQPESSCSCAKIVRYTMPLAPGDRLGPYEILSRIGAGGMGEVWRARDTRLDRVVAIKTAKAHFSERFEREARAIAALNHPHICQIYDVGADYLVMELVEGAPIKGPMALDKALKQAIQLASAMDAAHRKSITHRDLKPANILSTKSGIKVLDFGLAKMERAISAVTSDEIATKTVTQQGAIVGTLQYMAPEQLRGKDVDFRADIFSFGCVLYEMLTGKRAFDGADPACVIGAILEREPPPVGDVAPPALDRLLKRCVAKEPDDRYQSARDIRADLEWIAGGGGEGPPQAQMPATRRLFWPALTGFCLIAAVVFAFLWLRQPVTAPLNAQFSLLPPPGYQSATPVISPDGSMLVFSAILSGGTAAGPAASSLWLRPMGSLDTRPLAGTIGGSSPFWSPDSKALAFVANGKLIRIDIASGVPQVLCDAPTTRGTAVGGTWNADGIILFGGTDGLHRVSAEGGAPSRLTQTDTARQEEGHGKPRFLPGGKRFLYYIQSPNPNTRGVYAGWLQNPQRKIRVLATNDQAIYSPPRDGHPGTLLWLREQTLMAQAFDASSSQFAGNPSMVVQNVNTFDVSDAGSMVYKAGTSAILSRLVLMNREGGRISEVGEAAQFRSLHLSPDGKSATVGVADPKSNQINIWIYDMLRGLRTRFTADRGEFDGVWSPDGATIVFDSNPGGIQDLYRRSLKAGVAEELLFADQHPKFPKSWSSDGKFLLYHTVGDPETGLDIWILPDPLGAPGASKPVPFLRTRFNEAAPQFSPDGYWIVYQSDESGQNEIYATQFPGPGDKRLISTSGGTWPRWGRSGREIFYLSGDKHMMTTQVRAKGGALEVGETHTLFGPLKVPGPGNPFDVAPDGQRFLIALIQEQPVADVLAVVLNWHTLLKK
jgi:Tol biopolymer transport system component/predicted Ser/Thr protein kinase